MTQKKTLTDLSYRSVTFDLLNSRLLQDALYPGSDGASVVTLFGVKGSLIILSSVDIYESLSFQVGAHLENQLKVGIGHPVVALNAGDQRCHHYLVGLLQMGM